MSKVTEPMNAPDRKLPAVEENTAAGEVLEELARQQKGTFVLLQEGHPTHYVQGRELAQALFKVELPDSDRRNQITVGDLIGRGILERAMVPIDFQGFGIPEDIVLSQRGVILSVKGVPSRSWLEAVLDVQPPIFLCTNPGGSHKNNTWNNGKCGQCPFPIGGLA